MLKKVFMILLLLPAVIYADNGILANSESTDEHVVFDKTPIQFVVPVGKQRLISFPDKVSINNTDPSLTTDKVGFLNNNGTLYITAKKAFEPILLPVKLVTSGKVVLVYLSSTTSAKNNNPVDVVVAGVSQSAYDGNVPAEEPTLTFNAVSLLRFATQQFSYKRLAMSPNGISRTPLYTTRTVNIYYGDAVTGYPLASWRAGDLYVSVVQLKNTTDQSLTLDPRYVVGYWQAATFYRFDTVMKNAHDPQVPFNVLTPQGTERDYTLIMLVSNEPFGQAVKDLAPFNRAEIGGLR